MINEAIGSAAERDGQPMRLVRAGEQGHVIFGPYRFLVPGVYEVDFALALLGGKVAGDRLCAILDVTTNVGSVMIEERELRAARLSDHRQTFTLTFVLRDITQVEYRVWTSGAATLLVGCEPVLRRVSGVLDIGPPLPFASAALAPSALAGQVREALRHLRPYKMKNHGKVRLGKASDGGYLCVDDFEGIDTGFSFGINDDISWDLDAADRGLTILQFDHTVNDPAPNDPRMIFERKMIAAHSGPDRQSLADLIRAHDRGRDRPNIVLKMDIECGEWDVFGATTEEELARLAWIVCEVHAFQNLASEHGRRDIANKLEKLTRNFAVVHVHGNTFAGFSSIDNVIFPNVIEVTLANRSVYDIIDSDEVFPSDGDLSCNPELPDFFLGAFRY